MKTKKIILSATVMLLYIILAIPTKATWCYQESANTTNQSASSGTPDGDCGLDYSGSYIFDPLYLSFANGSFYDGNWSSGTTTATNGISYLKITYKKPSSATNSSIWQIKDANATTNLTILPQCWNSNTTHAIFTLVVNRPSRGTPYVLWDCNNGTSLNQLRLINSINTAFEDAMVWDIPEPATKWWKATNASDNTMVSIDSNGNLYAKQGIYLNYSGSMSDIKINFTNTSGNSIMGINYTGSIYFKGNITNNSALTGITAKYVWQAKDASPLAMLDNNGNMFLKGKYYDNTTP